MKPEMKKLIIANLPYLLFVYLFGKLGQAYRLAEGIDLSQKLLHFADGCAAAFESAAPSFNPFDLLIGVAGAAALRLMVYCKGKNAKKYRKGVEYGSARWGGPKDIAPYIDPNFDNNILLTQTERLTMNNRPKDPKTARNKNVLVIGGSGSGKTRFFVKPNLMQCVSKDYPTSFGMKDPVSWLGDKNTAIWTLILLAVWQFGSSMLIFLSSLKQIPPSLYEAASIDGAGKFRQFFKITLPLLTPTIFFNLVMQMINGFLAFTQCYIITQGKPMNSTLFYTVYMYQQSFEYYNTGYGAALAWVMLLIVGLITAFLFATKRFWVYEEGL